MPESQPIDSSEGSSEKEKRKPASFQGTAIGDHRASFDDDLSALIEETLAEVKPAAKPVSAPSSGGTPLSTATPMSAPKSTDQMNATPFAVGQNIKPVEPKEATAKPFRADRSTHSSPSAAEKPRPKKEVPPGEASIYDITFKEYNVGDIVAGRVVK